MKTGCFFWAVAVMMAFWAGNAGAEYYQYRNDKGVIVFTDDLSQVPVDQRKAVKKHTTVESAKPSEGKSSETDAPEKKGGSVQKTQPGSEDKTDFDVQRDALYKDHDLLEKEKQDLTLQGTLVRTPAEQEEYNLKVNQLNKKIEAYKLKIREFNSKTTQ